MNLLEVDNLSISLDGKTFLREVTFAVKEGESLALVGETGSGKSLLAKSLTGLLPSSFKKEGSVLWKGKNLLFASEKELSSLRGKEISLAFQDPLSSLNPTMTIGQQIIEALHHYPLSRKEAKQRVLSLLAELQIPQPEERFHHYPHTLSGGMRQRILLAIALITRPLLLIADEPTTALDALLQTKVLSLLRKKQRQEAMSLLLITHDLGLVRDFCDRVLVLHDGRIVESASVEELFSSPRHPYTQKLLQAAQVFSSSGLLIGEETS